MLFDLFLYVTSFIGLYMLIAVGWFLKNMGNKAYRHDKWYDAVLIFPILVILWLLEHK